MTTKLRRSYLFAAANRPDAVDAALGSGADVVILDLEDLITAAKKTEARALAAQRLAQARPCLLYVRVNGLTTPYCYDDLHAVIGAGLDGLILPKAEAPGDLATIDWIVTQIERARGLADGSVDVVPLIETAKGFERLTEIARAPARVRRLGFGAGDLATDLGLRWSRAETELIGFRTSLIAASRAAGLDPPIDAVWLRLDDEDGLRQATRTTLEFGFEGKFCLAPAQIPVVHDVLTPTAEELALAARIVAGYRQAVAAGAASLTIDGRFVDPPIARRYERLLAAADAIKTGIG